jgi:hypothetical protein
VTSRTVFLVLERLSKRLDLVLAFLRQVLDGFEFVDECGALLGSAKHVSVVFGEVV